jgi:hypothetical protein
MTLHAFDGVGYPEIFGRNLGSAALDGLHSLPTGSLWVGSEGKLQRYSGGAMTFETADYGTGFGSNLATVPGRLWVFSAGGYGVHGFRTVP